MRRDTIERGARFCIVRLRGDLFLPILILTTLAMHVLIGSLNFPGDEPRYVSQGLGAYTNHAYYPTHAAWHRLLLGAGIVDDGSLYGGQPMRPVKPFWTSLILGGPIALIGLNGARWCDVVIATFGLAILYRSLQIAFPLTNDRWMTPPRVATAIVGTSIPFLAYSQLLYPEILLFTDLSLCLSFFVRNEYVTAVFFAVLLPFIHVRTAPMAAVVIVSIFLTAAFDKRRSVRALVRLAMLAIAGSSAFVALQFLTFGRLTGGAFATFGPSLDLVPIRIGMQLFDVRHGLIAYSPLMLVGFAGLIAGLVTKQKLCALSSVLIGVYAGTFMWATAAESYSERYWVAVLPAFAVGIAYWVSCFRSARWLPLMLPFAIVGAANIAVFVAHPGWYLAAHRVSTPYAYLSGATGIRLGMDLPVDSDSVSTAYVKPIPFLLVASAGVQAVLVVCAVTQRRNARAIARSPNLSTT